MLKPKPDKGFIVSATLHNWRYLMPIVNTDTIHPCSGPLKLPFNKEKSPAGVQSDGAYFFQHGPIKNHAVQKSYQKT